MAKIESLLRRMFPYGTRGDSKWDEFPEWPIDLFAFAATLVEQSGAYHYVVRVPQGGKLPDPLGIRDAEWLSGRDAAARAMMWGLLAPSTAERDDQRKLKAREKEDPAFRKLAERSPGHKVTHTPFSAQAVLDAASAAEALVRADWKIILSACRADITDFADRKGSPPAWCGAAVRLMIVCDLACVGAGFHSPPRRIANKRPSRVDNWIQSRIAGAAADKQASRKARAKAPQSGAVDQDDAWFSSFTSDNLWFEDYVDGSGRTIACKDKGVFDSSVCAVLPKTRTSTVGCTLRSLSHNLALLPPASEVEVRWRMPDRRPPNPRPTVLEPEKHDLNLLLVPFPYRMGSDCFSPTYSHDSGWGFYEIEQRWLKTGEGARSQFASFVEGLVRRATAELGSVHGVIFPELALNSDYFVEVANNLKRNFTSNGVPGSQRNGSNGKKGKSGPANEFEFVVAGLSDQRDQIDNSTSSMRPGNFVSLLGVERDCHTGSTASADPPWSVRGSRDKHHRWKLNGRQIERYGISHKLDKKLSWWEQIALSRRVVEFFQLRAGTSTTILICEDLARADPVQGTLRSIGPNLVIALLMDGPQRAYRWSGHYAGSLADDPGSSVLTLTSFGLIERGSALDGTRSRSIGFFKGAYGKDEQELQLPVGSHALALRLSAEDRTEHTLDFRGDEAKAFVWRLADVCPVQGDVNSSNGWIIGNA